MTDNLSCRIPFCGFYESLYSSAIDDHAHQEAERFAGEDGTPLDDVLGVYAPTLIQIADRLPSGAVFDAVSDALSIATDYSAAYQHLAKAYAEEFLAWLADTLDRGAIDGAFEEMQSPRYYNFESDRIFASIPTDAIEDIIRRLRDEAPGKLEAAFKAQFTSRSGFISHYDNTVPEKGLAEWDHNELYAVLLAWCEHNCERGDISEELYDWRCGGLYEEVYRAFDVAVDWDKFKDLLEAAAEALAEYHEIDTGEAEERPYRCPHTLDLFDT
jgi:hypothetical protein